MNQQAKGQALWLIFAAICFSFILLIDGLPWVRGGFGALTLISLAAWFMLDRRRQKEQIEMEVLKAVKSKDELLSYAFSIHRHDLLNDVQLLMAYLKMNKIDKLQKCVDNMKQRLLDESLLFKIGSPSFTSRLFALKLGWKSAVLTIEGDFPERIMEKCTERECSEEAVLQVLQMLKRCSLHTEGEPNCLSLHISMTDGLLRMDMNYEGAYNTAEWEDLWNHHLDKEVFSMLKQSAGRRFIQLEISFSLIETA
ncbi:Spo0B domain-containing protein [Marinicrinis lubricantis]|uniref:Spo0B domain-containing protein n=1 Tax=Marinicrinis lubricantis TaxID=2086470 RepID=A0ABW1IU23_9BACL